MEYRRCYGCMEMVSGDVCPHCGFPAGGDNDPHQLRVGTVFRDQYLVGRVLGQGGFGITYLGWDNDLGRKVAIKEFYPSSMVNRDNALSATVRLNATSLEGGFIQGRERFLRESRALAKLTHVSEIVGIFATFQENNTAYIVMEYIKGTELAKYVKLRGGKLEAGETLRLLAPIIRALETVHKEGLIHRDISPDNIMLHPMGGAKLLDFGAVRSVENPDAKKDLTHSTEAIVKHGFAPPEQYRNRGGLGPWTDMYALCATIYYCLTGTVPPDALSRSLYREELDWSKVEGLTQEQLDALQKGLSLQAEDRFSDMGQLYTALFGEPEEPMITLRQERVVTTTHSKTQTTVTRKNTTTTGESPQPGRKNRTPILAAAAALVVLAAIGIGLLVAKPSGKPSAQVSAPTTEPATVQSEAVSALPESTEQTNATPDMNGSSEETIQNGSWEDNVLTDYPFIAMGLGSYEVLSVTFTDTLAGAPDDAVDLCRNAIGTVLGWQTDGHVTIASDGGVNGRDACYKLFYECENLTTVEFGGAFHTEQAETMEEMFYGCMQLRQVDLSGLDTGSVTNMHRMFWKCESMELFEVADWNVASVTDMNGMFSRCTLLRTVDVKDWNVANVTDMEGMFYLCTGLKTLDVSNWNVGNVRKMNWMFRDCSNLQTLDVSKWDMRRIEDLSQMFYRCRNLSHLDVTNWEVPKTANVKLAFGGCNNLQNLGSFKGW